MALRGAVACALCLNVISLHADPIQSNRPPLPGFRISAWYGEQTCEERSIEGVRTLLNAPSPALMDPARPTLLVVYATPNGNSIEETMGSTLENGVDWHFGIQNVAAQIRRLREVDTRENVVVACVEAEGLSWPMWRQKHPDSPNLVRELVDSIVRRVPGAPVRIALVAHSGGGSFLFGYINGGSTIPANIDRIAMLDSNYSFEVADGHGDKLKSWLEADTAHRLVVVAYDDRNITLNGKPVVSATGGTYRATHRMIDALGKSVPFTESDSGLFYRYEGIKGQALMLVHRNPDNKILHTALVGEMNGLLMALTRGTPEESTWGHFGGPRAYSAWIQPADRVAAAITAKPVVVLPPRQPGTETGSARNLLTSLIGKPQGDAELILIRALTDGNIPEFLRNFKTIHVTAIDAAGQKHTAEFDVMPDYLSIGTDAEFVRLPLTPVSAERVATAFKCVLPTRKMVDDIYRASEVKLDPIPLIQDRESIQTFILHNGLIEAEREGKALGLLLAGAKKDVVVSNRVQERPNRVALYGWQRLDGVPIQPLTIVHRSTYVDYSHGIRLVSGTVRVDGKTMAYDDVLRDPVLNIMLSDEGPILHPSYVP